jgi:hypothetical protein
VAIIGVDGKKGVTLKGVSADGNDTNNIYLNDIEGSANLSDIEANGSGSWGIHITYVNGSKGVTIKNANASGNTYINIDITTITGGGLTLDTVTASGSTGSNGIHADNVAGSKGVIFKNVTSSSNHDRNVDLNTITGNVTFNTVTCDSSANDDGIYLLNISGSKGVVFSNVNASTNKGLNIYMYNITGNVSLSNTNASSSPTKKGINISHVSGTKGITMKGVTANGNYDNNINLSTITGNISIGDVEANNSGDGDGLNINAVSGSKGLTFSGVTTNGNNDSGVYISGITGNVKMSNIEASNNILYKGIWLVDVHGSKGLSLSNIIAVNNNSTNIYTSVVDGNASFKTITASESKTDYGMAVRNIYGTKGVTLNGLTAEDNDDTNLWIDTITGDVSLKDVTVSKSTTNYGVELSSISGAKGVKVANLSSTGNNAYNIWILDITGDVSLSNITSHDSNSMGVYINNVKGSKGVAVKNGALSGNNSNNLYIQNVPNGYVTLSGINADSSSIATGAVIDSVNGVLMVMSSTFNGNKNYGMLVTNQNGQISINDVEASNTVSFDGVNLTSSANQLVCSSEFSNNPAYGILTSADGFSITLSNVLFSGNTGGDIATIGTIVQNTSTKCKVIPAPAP